jgi:hypothetical protein
VVGAAPAQAQTETTAETAAPVEERIDLLCARVPVVTDRLTGFLDRITGDGEGSIVWLEEKAEQARTEGRDQLADALDTRAEIRRERVDVLEVRLDRLAEAAAFCAEQP